MTAVFSWVSGKKTINKVTLCLSYRLISTLLSSQPILFLSAIAFASERTVVGQKITGTVVVILLAIVAANVGVIPHSAPAYGFIFSYIVPMLIPLFLFQADIRRLARERREQLPPSLLPH